MLAKSRNMPIPISQDYYLILDFTRAKAEKLTQLPFSQTMASLSITDASVPDLHGKFAFVTGGSSGIGLATVKILAKHGATCYILDIEPPQKYLLPVGAIFIKCDTNSWNDLNAAFREVRVLDIAVANAGVSESEDFLEDEIGDDGELVEPKYGPLGVNYRGVLNFIKLAVSKMKTTALGGSIVITSSATAYAPEQSLPVYSATKLGVSSTTLASTSHYT
jgi:NAD(P)-dependent dehydrogenase (short-subunit alcohol dehydrogenase family)